MSIGDDGTTIPKQLPVTNLLAENSFGAIDISLRRLLTNSVRCVSDRLMIRSAGHMVYGTSAARDVRKLIPEVDAIQRAFDDRQKQKKIDSVTALAGKASSYQKRKLEYLEACKEHSGPFSNPHDIDEFLARCKAENRTRAYMKKAFKSEVNFARETYTKRPKTDDAFRIRDRTTNKDLSPEQYAQNLRTLFTNILAVAEVPTESVRGAIHKAVAAAGIGYLDSQSTPTVMASPTVENTCSIDSPPSFSINGNNFFINDFVAIAVVSDEQNKAWQLGMIDSLVDDCHASVSFFIPVPGRMGQKRVAFFAPEEEQVIIPTNSFIPLHPKVDRGKLNDTDVYIVSNHEDIDEVVPHILV